MKKGVCNSQKGGLDLGSEAAQGRDRLVERLDQEGLRHAGALVSVLPVLLFSLHAQHKRHMVTACFLSPQSSANGGADSMTKKQKKIRALFVPGLCVIATDSAFVPEVYSIAFDFAVAYLHALHPPPLCHLVPVRTTRYLSTALCVALYAISVPHFAWHHTLSQYRTSRSTIRCLSTAQRTANACMVAAYPFSVTHIA
eukprot:2317420-Rhodomonas_salina.1